jgi:hypothetical protein
MIIEDENILHMLCPNHGPKRRLIIHTFYNCLTTYTAGNAFMNRRRLDEKYFDFSFL